MEFPKLRPRRLRKNENIRRLVRETKLSLDDLIYPIFVRYGEGIVEEVPSMPGVYRYSLDKVVDAVKEVRDLGIPAIILFGIPEHKDEVGSDTWSDEGIIQRALRLIKKEVPDMYVITDVCFCEYTSHGHCGVLCEGDVHNDLTLENLKKQAISHAKNGADMLAPSGMMDGMVKAIREAFDSSGFENIPIMAYSAKYASAFYGPFRDIAESAPAFGDRRSYQMDPANSRAECERAFLRELHGGCQVPIGAYAWVEGNTLKLKAFISDLKGERFIEGYEEGRPEEAQEIGKRLAKRLLESGGEEILRDIYQT